MANHSAAFKDVPRQQSQRDMLAESHKELLELVERHYERTGDPSLKEVVDRAKLACRR